MDSRLTAKTALITGGAKRLGRATALALAEAGANVVIHYGSSRQEALATAEEATRLGVRSWTVRGDLLSRDPASIVDEAARLAGGLDILINNASIFPTSRIEDVTLDQIVENVTVNAWGPLALARRFAELGQRGHIVNFLDTRVTGFDWSHVAYQSSKHMLALFTRMMAAKFGPGLQVNAVAPGLILPPEGKDASYLDSLKDRTVLKRTGSPREVTDAVLYLLRSDFVTGQVIYVDGGRHLLEAVGG